LQPGRDAVVFGCSSSEIPRLYTVGQCEPIRETLTPEKERQVFGHWIQLNILKMFLDDEQQSLEM
jgi:hypothetical protein